MPAAISSGTGQMPDASFKFDDGQWQTCAPARREQALLFVRQVDAVRDACVRTEQAELVEDDDVVLAERRARDQRDLAGFSLAWVWIRTPCHALRCRPRGAARRCTDSTNRGAYA